VTIKEFFAALERRTREMDTVWRVNDDVEIRTDDGHCPLSFVADTTPGVVRPATLALHVPDRQSAVLSIAADYPESSDWRVQVLRDRLLLKCRLVD